MRSFSCDLQHIWASASINDYVYMRTNNAIISKNKSKNLIALWCLHVKSKALHSRLHLIYIILIFAKNCGYFFTAIIHIPHCTAQIMDSERAGARFSKEVQPNLEFKLELWVDLPWDGKLKSFRLQNSWIVLVYSTLSRLTLSLARVPRLWKVMISGAPKLRFTMATAPANWKNSKIQK